MVIVHDNKILNVRKFQFLKLCSVLYLFQNLLNISVLSVFKLKDCKIISFFFF